MAPKNQHHKTATSATSPDNAEGAFDEKPSSCCFSNVSEKMRKDSITFVVLLETVTISPKH